MLTPGVNPVSTTRGPGQNGGDSTTITSFEGNSGIPGGFLANASIQGQQNRSRVSYVDGIINSSVRAGTYVALPDVDALLDVRGRAQLLHPPAGAVGGRWAIIGARYPNGTKRRGP
jgi:hypothetical protein